jgi:hypothetical protein
MQAKYQHDVAAAAREIDYLRAECLKLGSALENRSAEDLAREQSERELLELLAIVQENVQLSKQVHNEAERAGFNIAEGGQLSTADKQQSAGDRQPSAGDEQLSVGDAQLSAGNKQLSQLDKREQHGRGQRPRPKSAGAAPDVAWSKGTVVFTPALNRSGSDLDGSMGTNGEFLASFGGKPSKGGQGQRGRGRLTARIRELERQLEEALARPQVRATSFFSHVENWKSSSLPELFSYAWFACGGCTIAVLESAMRFVPNDEPQPAVEWRFFFQSCSLDRWHFVCCEEPIGGWELPFVLLYQTCQRGPTS